MSSIISLPYTAYSRERRGPFKLYVYDHNGRHRGGQWFEVKPKYPKESITATRAKLLARTAISLGREVRITDGGDFLVLHAVNGEVLYPPEGAVQFWKEVMEYDTNPG